MNTIIKRPSEYLKDYHSNINVSNTSLKVKYPLNFVFSYNNYDLLTHLLLCLFLHMLSQTLILKLWNRVVKHVCWKKSIQCQIFALELNQTWETVLLPKNKPAISCKWVFKIKYKANGIVERYKARLVANGYTQTKGIENLVTFSLVAKMTTIRLIISLTFNNNWDLTQLDISNAFLHGKLKENIYMVALAGLTSIQPRQVSN